MKPAFREGATLFGYVGDELFAGPLQGLFDWNDQTGPAKELVIRVVGVDVFETIAMARIECDNWTGHKYTDFLSLLKIDGGWKIMNKVFHLHS